MQFLPLLCLTGWGNAISSTTICAVVMTLIALLLAAPALGDESCVADSSAGTICKHEAVGSHNVIDDDDDDTTRGRADDDVI